MTRRGHVIYYKCNLHIIPLDPPILENLEKLAWQLGKVIMIKDTGPVVHELILA